MRPHHPLDLGLDAPAEAFRAGVCTWLTGAMAPERTAHHTDPADRTGLDEKFERELLREAGERGLLGVSLPFAMGGGGRPATWAAAFAYEVAWHHAPLVDTGVTLAARPVIAYGSARQRSRLLPGMLGGTEMWCCAYTEPTSGNDLFAGLATRGEQDGDGVWRLTGVKSRITGGAKAERCLTAAQTRHGPAMFVVDLRAAGDTVAVRRMPTLAGYTLDELEFDATEAELLGEAGAGRRQAARAIRAEQGGMFHLGWAHRIVADLTAWARTTGAADLRGADPVAAARAGVLRDALGGLWAGLAAERAPALAPVAAATAVKAVKADPAAAAVAKVRLTEFVQAAARIAADTVAGNEDPSAAARFEAEAVFRLDGPISVGANDLHRATIAALVLGERGEAIAEPTEGEGLLADAVAAAEQALRIAVEYVGRRQAYGTVLAKLPVVRQRLADMRLELAAARGLVAQRGEADELAARAVVGPACHRVVEDAILLCGAHGYLRESGLGDLRAITRLAELAHGGPTSARAELADRALREGW
ncbi:acyl-CoA dehydrogenase family protein [Yinghuangia seranimata]|uniref:acyl-CoA dehydrogenase family protein n=1 Tax=Yinghuangia seranimata TaxID=408067 RepID=UPI00248BE085|nr:acyl-CoA dehydrogenase family protein [Yinghuangia seranimata]MDI2128276.1 acyl-CoA dehydrogenase family protein [Yinghuangia seranimata]